MRCSAINERGEQCADEAVDRYGWCRKHGSMRRMNVRTVMTSWLVIGGSALVLLAVLHCFQPLPHPWLAAIGTSAASLVIASGQEWGRTRIARRARSSDATRRRSTVRG